MPKRYREWLFRDNIAKPRSTEVRHAKKTAHSGGPLPLGDLECNVRQPGEHRVEDAASAVSLPADVLNGEECTSEDFLDDPAADPSLGSLSDGIAEACNGQLYIVQSVSATKLLFTFLARPVKEHFNTQICCCDFVSVRISQFVFRVLARSAAVAQAGGEQGEVQTVYWTNLCSQKKRGRGGDEKKKRHGDSLRGRRSSSRIPPYWRVRNL